MLDEQAISKLLGADSVILGLVIATVIGCITWIPGFVAFPLAASMVAAGAGYVQIAVFISTPMMVRHSYIAIGNSVFGKAYCGKKEHLAAYLCNYHVMYHWGDYVMARLKNLSKDIASFFFWF